MLIDDRTVLYHAVEPFIDIPSLQAVIVTYPYGLHDETELALDNLMFAYGVPITLVEGGATRQESVLRALEQLESLQTTIEYVAIHDGARPWVDQQPSSMHWRLRQCLGGRFRPSPSMTQSNGSIPTAV